MDNHHMRALRMPDSMEPLIIAAAYRIALALWKGGSSPDLETPQSPDVAVGEGSSTVDAG
jgi:hypothetical protein